MKKKRGEPNATIRNYAFLPKRSEKPFFDSVSHTHQRSGFASILQNFSKAAGSIYCVFSSVNPFQASVPSPNPFSTKTTSGVTRSSWFVSASVPSPHLQRLSTFAFFHQYFLK